MEIGAVTIYEDVSVVTVLYVRDCPHSHLFYVVVPYEVRDHLPHYRSFRLLFAVEQNYPAVFVSSVEVVLVPS